MTSASVQPRTQVPLDYFDVLIDRHDAGPLGERIWGLRHRYTSYGAAYLALTVALGAPLQTCEAKLASGGHTAVVRAHASTARQG